MFHLADRSRLNRLRTLAVRRLNIVALIVGAGLAVWLAGIDDPRGLGGQQERNWVAGYLDNQHQFGQIADLPLDRLIGIRLWLPQPSAPGNGTITLRLRALESGADLGRAQLAPAALTPAGPTLFRFDTLSISPLYSGRSVPVELRLEGQGLERSSAISVLAGTNRYSGGLLLREGRQIPRADLAFEPVYQASWFDRILPITQIAWARPGIFGWPPLYALLAWLLLWGDAWLLFSVIRASVGDSPKIPCEGVSG